MVVTQLFDTIAMAGPTSSQRFAQVALEQGIDSSSTGLTYSIPETLSDIAVGDRVIVPLGRRNEQVSGFVVELAQQTDITHVKSIIGRDSHSISLTPDLVELARWISNYYCCPLGMVFSTMLPAAVKHGTGLITQIWVRRKPDLAAEISSKITRLPKLQSAVLAVLDTMEKEGRTWGEIKRVADLAGARSVAPVKQLIVKGYLESKQTREIHADWGEEAHRLETAKPDHVLTPSQTRAIQKLAASVHQGFSVHLLHGATGSGKTEVYLRVIEHLLQEHDKANQAGRKGSDNSQPGAIVLVPEIALTPQTAARFVGRFPDVAVLHSGLSGAQRHEEWRRIREGRARIVVGARSAVFAPLPNLGVIIVDEEHESSFKQDQLPRYHARDVAVKRGQLLNIPVVLGSATPSLESYYNATVRGSYHLLELPDRVAGLKLPEVEIIDMGQERRKRRGVHLMSLRLEQALQTTIDAGGQAILMLNRRGYANYLACPDHRCGWMMECKYCDATMVYHKDARLSVGGLVRCHHCEAEQLLPPTCPDCGRKVTTFGLGTQRVEEELQRKLPNVRFIRMDSDAMRTGKDYQRSLEAFRGREVDVLLGTQMIAKGLDFPNVRLVGVISGDTSLHLPDFRASERTFQLIAQVAGRAGRGDATTPGLVIVQTFNPGDAAIGLASRHDFVGFAKREMALRREVNLPPCSRMARIVVRNTNQVTCHAEVKQLADQLAAANQAQGNHVRIRGPMPCPIGRIADHFRQQIELIAPDAATMQRLLTAVRNARALRSDNKMAVDVDPVSLL